jgi:hypothetical protein
LSHSNEPFCRFTRGLRPEYQDNAGPVNRLAGNPGDKWISGLTPRVVVVDRLFFK